MDIILTIDHLQAVHIGGCLQRASLTGHTPIIPENSLLDRWQALLVCVKKFSVNFPRIQRYACYVLFMLLLLLIFLLDYCWEHQDKSGHALHPHADIVWLFLMPAERHL